jgi:hypothetical protein
MTKEQARTTANVVLVAAGVAAAYVVWTNPPLRRLALRGAQLWLGASLPLYFLEATSRAWVESGHRA